MPDSTINGLSALAAASVVPGTDVVPVWQASASTTKKVTVTDVVTAGRAAGTISASAPATTTQTWNNAGVTFTAVLTNVTDTLSASGSLLEDWQVGGVSKFNVKKDGSITLASSASINIGSDVVLLRDGASDSLAMKRGGGTQSFRVYNAAANAYKALVADGNLMLMNGITFTNGSGAAVGTLTNAPSAGNPTKWIPVSDNGTTRYIPAW